MILRRRRDASESANFDLLLHSFDRDDVNAAVLSVHNSRYFGSHSFERQRRTRIIEFIVGPSCIVIQGEMIAVWHIAVPRKGLVFPFHSPRERLRLDVFFDSLPGGVRSLLTAIFLVRELFVCRDFVGRRGARAKDRHWRMV